jgi:hypothetical protein
MNDTDSEKDNEFLKPVYIALALAILYYLVQLIKIII